MEQSELFVYGRIIKKRLWLMGVIVGVTMVVMFVVFLSAQPQYRATASFQVTAPLPADVSLFTDFRTPTSREELGYSKNNFLAVLRSEAVAGEVIDQLGLNWDAEELLAHSDVELDPNSDFIRLRITSDDPKMSAAIANAIVDKATERFGQLSAAMLTTSKQTLEQQIQNTGKELDDAQSALQQFRLANNVGVMNQLVESQQNLIRQLTLQHDQAAADGATAKAGAYDQLIAKRQQELQNLIVLNSEYSTLNDRVQRIGATYSSLQDKETEIELKENEVISAKFVQVIPAREPARALPRVDATILALGVLGSLAASVLLAFTLEYVERNRRLSRKTTLTEPSRDGHTEVSVG